MDSVIVLSTKGDEKSLWVGEEGVVCPWGVAYSCWNSFHSCTSEQRLALTPLTKETCMEELSLHAASPRVSDFFSFFS